MADEEKGRVISPKDYQVIEKLVNDYVGGRLGPGPDMVRRRRPGGGGGSTKQYANITRSLQRPDPTTTPPIEEISRYKVKLASEADFSAWAATHGDYEAGDKVLWTDGLDYVCSTGHSSSSGRSPDNSSYWTVHSPDAYILGYPYTDLIGTVPWFEVGAEVEVVVREGVYYIHETASRCEEVVNNRLSTSMQYNVDEKRTMAVYK